MSPQADVGTVGVPRFSERNVYLTDHELRVGKKSYALSQIWLAIGTEVPPVRWAQGALLTQCALALLYGIFFNVREAIGGALLIIPFAILWWARARPRLMIFLVGKDDKPRCVFRSSDREFAARLLTALQELVNRPERSGV